MASFFETSRERVAPRDERGNTAPLEP